MLRNKSKKDIDYTSLREEMVKKQLISRDVKDRVVLSAMKTVPRHLFVDENNMPNAYNDGPLPIGNNQTISQPYIVASMTEHLNLTPQSKVLEIGTGCGYQSAVLAEIAKSVYTIEIIPELYKQAQSTLKKLHYNNILCKLGDGAEGWLEYAPYDAIIITAATPKIPEKLIEQLGSNGTMILPLQGDYFNSQDLIKVSKKNDKLIQKSLYSVRFVPMTGMIAK